MNSLVGTVRIGRELLEQSVSNWAKHCVPRMGAALAFYTAISLPPLATLTLSLLSYAVKRDVARRQILEAFHFLVGTRGGRFLDQILAHTIQTPSNFWGSLASFFILLLAATQVFGELQNSLDQIWGIGGNKPSLYAFIRNRMLSVAMIVACGLLFLVSLFISTVTNQTSLLVEKMGLSSELLHWSFLFCSSTILFAALFRFLPRVSLTISDVWPGALLTGFLFVMGRWVVGIYLEKSPLSSTYGNLSSLLVALLCVFYLAQIFYFGAEFTRSYSKRFGSHGEVSNQTQKITTAIRN